MVEDYNKPVSEPFLNNDLFARSPEGKSRGITALLAIFLGGLGIHYFYLGKATAGLLILFFCLITHGVLVIIFEALMLPQGINMLCMDNEKFRQKYVVSPSGFPLF